MKQMLKNRQIRISLIILFLGSILQPYFVFILNLGRSNECWNCTIIEQTFFTSLIYLFIPLTVIYLFLNKIQLNVWLISIVCTLYLAIVSFFKLTVPLFDDRHTTWSTYSNEEIFDYSLMLGGSFLVIYSVIFATLLFIANEKTKSHKDENLVDNQIS